MEAQVIERARPVDRARGFLYDLLHTPEIDSKLERWLRAAIAVLIGLTIIVVILETVHSIKAVCGVYFEWFEIITVGIFSVEYLLRVWSVTLDPRYAHPVWGRLRYAMTPFALVDLIAIAPFFLPHVVDLDLMTLRGLRLARLLRVMKLGRFSQALGMLGRIVRNKLDEILAATTIMIALLLVASTLMYYIEHEAQPEAFPNIPAALWWGVVTLTSVGYGDVYPVTVLGKLCAGVIALVGIGIVALPSAVIVAGFVEEMQSRRAAALCPHCGKPVNAGSVVLSGARMEEL